MKKPVTKYALREILRNGTVHPQISFTVTAQEIADLLGKTPQKPAALIMAAPNAPDTMVVRGLSQLTSGDPAFKAEKDITLAYVIFARRAMRHDHTVTVWCWSGQTDVHADSHDEDDFASQEKYSSPDEMMSFAPCDFRKNHRLPVTEAARKFYERILAKRNIGEETPSHHYALKIFSCP